MEVGNFQFHRRAFAAFNQLADAEQGQVLELLASLAGIPAPEWPAAQSKKLPGEQAFFLLHVNDNLRVIVRASEGQPPEVMDIVRRQRLESFARGGTKAIN